MLSLNGSDEETCDCTEVDEVDDTVIDKGVLVDFPVEEKLECMRTLVERAGVGITKIVDVEIDDPLGVIFSPVDEAFPVLTPVES